MYYHKDIATHLTINPENIKGIAVDETSPSKRIAGTYLHGLLETNNQFDIFRIVGPLPTSIGIYPAKVLGRPDNDNECTLFLWVCKSNRTHGLVVLNREKRAMKYALEQYNKRAIAI
jgi:hypothetical protein